MKVLPIIAAALLPAFSVAAKEYHVSATAADAGDGSHAKPFETISAAAEVAQPGDVITVHEGVYRGRVTPPRGGESDSRTIRRPGTGELRIMLDGFGLQHTR